TSPQWGFNIRQQRLQVVLELQPSRAFERWSQEAPDLVVFDIDPMEALAIDLIRELREQAVIPILMLASNPTDTFMLEAYDAGVDEYILKPIHPSLLRAKIKAWLRRSWSIPVDMLDSLQFGSLQLVPAERTIRLEGREPVRLTNLELRLMFYLLSHPGRTLTAEDLCQRVWGNYADGSKTTLKNVVYRLRNKIEADPAHPRYIRTVAGVGYQFTPE
ncbi:MAG TPA: response regulator transcription factor, partial [Anaerolineales bacterium]|nr:response regulator transcription factor [Anaerolineales bacterium]